MDLRSVRRRPLTFRIIEFPVDSGRSAFVGVRRRPLALAPQLAPRIVADDSRRQRSSGGLSGCWEVRSARRRGRNSRVLASSECRQCCPVRPFAVRGKRINSWRTSRRCDFEGGLWDARGREVACVDVGAVGGVVVDIADGFYDPGAGRRVLREAGGALQGAQPDS